MMKVMKMNGRAFSFIALKYYYPYLFYAQRVFRSRARQWQLAMEEHWGKKCITWILTILKLLLSCRFPWTSALSLISAWIFKNSDASAWCCFSWNDWKSQPTFENWVFKRQFSLNRLSSGINPIVSAIHPSLCPVVTTLSILARHGEKIP